MSTSNPYRSAPNQSDSLPEHVVHKAENIIRDANLAVVVGLIPLIALIYIFRLTQWYVLRRQYPMLTEKEGDSSNLAMRYRGALPRLWFAVLFWPVLFVLMIVLAVSVSATA